MHATRTASTRSTSQAPSTETRRRQAARIPTEMDSSLNSSSAAAGSSRQMLQPPTLVLRSQSVRDTIHTAAASARRRAVAAARLSTSTGIVADVLTIASIPTGADARVPTGARVTTRRNARRSSVVVIESSGESEVGAAGRSNVTTRRPVRRSSTVTGRPNPVGTANALGGQNAEGGVNTVGRQNATTRRVVRRSSTSAGEPNPVGTANTTVGRVTTTTRRNVRRRVINSAANPVAGANAIVGANAVAGGNTAAGASAIVGANAVTGGNITAGANAVPWHNTQDRFQGSLDNVLAAASGFYSIDEANPAARANGVNRPPAAGRSTGANPPPVASGPTEANSTVSFDCSVCLETLSAPTTLVSNGNSLELELVATTCGHMYHKACLFQWFIQQNSRSCPSCRNALPPAKIIKLFPDISTNTEQRRGQVDSGADSGRLGRDSIVPDLYSHLERLEENMMLMEGRIRSYEEREQRLLGENGHLKKLIAYRGMEHLL